MKSLIVLCAAVLMTACSTPRAAGYRQAAPMPMPVEPPPAYTPGYAPGTPGEPVYTPSGAGLYQPDGSGGRPVERSKNHRVLPVSDEKGVWAADGDPTLAALPPSEWETIAGVPLPLPVTATSKASKDPRDLCATTMNTALRQSAQMAPVLSLSDVERRCVAAKLYKHCAAALRKDSEERGALGRPEPSITKWRIHTDLTANDFVKAVCPGASQSVVDAIVAAVVKYWPPSHGSTP